MKKRKCSFGGEKCGHFIFYNKIPTGDGLLASIEILKLFKRGLIKRFMPKIYLLPQKRGNIKITKKTPLEKLHFIQSAVKKAENLLKEGRIMIRYSGTEDLIRVLVEGKNYKDIEKIFEMITKSIKKEDIYDSSCDTCSRKINKNISINRIKRQTTSENL